MKKKRCRNRSKAISKRSGLTVLVAGLIRQIETSEQTLYQWKKKYKALEVDQVRHVVLIDKVASARAHLEQVRTHNGHRGIEAVAGLPSYGHNDVSCSRVGWQVPHSPGPHSEQLGTSTA